MTKEKFNKLFNETVSKMLDVDIKSVKNSANLDYDLGADDLNRVELLMEFESIFDISIDEDSYDRCEGNIGKLRELIFNLCKDRLKEIRPLKSTDIKIIKFNGSKNGSIKFKISGITELNFKSYDSFSEAYLDILDYLSLKSDKDSFNIEIPFGVK